MINRETKYIAAVLFLIVLILASCIGAGVVLGASVESRLARIEQRMSSREVSNKHIGAVGIGEFRDAYIEMTTKLDAIREAVTE